jgi:predicted neuraminidase
MAKLIHTPGLEQMMPMLLPTFTHRPAKLAATAAAFGGALVLFSDRVDTAPTAPPQAQSAAIVSSEFLYESAPFPSVHASTMAETRDGMVAAFFGGTRESAPDVGIWVVRQEKGKWTAPVEVANGVQPDGSRHPCWNPVLFEMPDQSLALFYKVGPTPRTWWGVVRTSKDAGRTWGAPQRLPDGILGPIKNKPVRLSDGTIISPSSTESDEKPSLWRVHFERSTDEGRTWTIVRPPVVKGAQELQAIQPSILVLGGNRLEAVGRSRSGKVFQTVSEDGGKSWSPLSLTSLPNPSSGTDAVTLRDGRHLIVYNHTPKGRTPLNIALSRDGVTWEAGLTLEREPGEYSYPAVIQASDGRIHVSYTWKRERVRHVVIDPTRLTSAPLTDGNWPAGR